MVEQSLSTKEVIGSIPRIGSLLFKLFKFLGEVLACLSIYFTMSTSKHIIIINSYVSMLNNIQKKQKLKSTVLDSSIAH